MLIRMDFVFYALAAIGALALLFVGGFLLAGLWQPQEPRHVDPDLLIEMPRPATESQGWRRWRFTDEETAALVELLRLAIAWNPWLRSPRVEQWKAALAKLDPASAVPEPVQLPPIEPDHAPGITQMRASGD